MLAPDQEPVGANRVHWVVEQITATQQMGTHVDGLNHLHVEDRTYNGHRLADIRTPYGTATLGIDTLPQVVTRGLCLDVAAVRGVDRLGPGEVITPADAEKALASAGLAVLPGDAVLFHTGHGTLGYDDPGAYATGEPGPGTALGEWLVEHRVALTGCDTWSYGPYLPEDADVPFVVPQTLNAHHGVVVVENLRLAEFVRDRGRGVPAGRHALQAARRHRRLGRAAGGDLTGHGSLRERPRARSNARVGAERARVFQRGLTTPGGRWFPSKFALFNDVLNVAIVGDDRPVPVAQRPEWQQALAQGREPDMLALYVDCSSRPGDRCLRVRLGQPVRLGTYFRPAGRRDSEAAVTVGAAWDDAVVGRRT